MNDQESEKYFDSLSGILIDKQLGWVLDQVVEQIRLGKIEEKEITPYKEVGKRSTNLTLFDTGIYKKTKKEKFQIVVPYTPQEKLLLLIEAIQKLFIDSAEMQIRTANELRKDNQNLSEIKFIDEEHEGASFTIPHGDDLSTTRERSEKLNSLLKRLIAEAGDDNK